MMTRDDHRSATPIDRLISALLAFLFGFPFGWLLSVAVAKFTDVGSWLMWVPPGAIAAYALIAPSRSRDMIGEVLAGILDWWSSFRR